DRWFRVGRCEQEINDAQAESEVVGAGLRVDERAGGDARDVPRGGDRGAVVAGFDFDPASGRIGAARGERQRLASLVLDADQRLRLPRLSHGVASSSEDRSDADYIGGQKSKTRWFADRESEGPPEH